MRQNLFGIFASSLICLNTVQAVEPIYNFREAKAYRELPEPDREKLATVHRDFMTLWGALDLYADDHAGNPPESLDDLVPHYLHVLPSDPFAEKNATTEQRNEGHYRISKNGEGYRYRAGSPGNRAWVVSSCGLPDFPYLAKRGNIGLYRCKGTWISGMNPRMIQLP